MEAAKRYGAFVAAAVVALTGFALGDYGILAWLAALLLVCVGVVLESTRAGVAATAILGLGCSVYLFFLKLTDAGSICDVSAKVSCSVVNTSAASMLFGIPIAVLGAGFFLGVAIAAATQARELHRLYATVGLLGLGGSAYSVYLATQAYAIGATCPMCMTIYGCNALLVYAAIRGAQEQGVSLFADLPEVARSTASITVAATFALTTLGGQAYYTRASKTAADEVLERLGAASPSPARPAPAAPSPAGAQVGATEPAPAAAPAPPGQDVAEDLRQLYVRPRGTVELEGDEPVLGDPNAPYVVVEFACFGCPHCAQAYGQLHQLVEQEPKIQVRFRAFPLSAECNPALPKGGRPEVCRAAMAAYCAGRQGKFWDYAGLLFANQRSLGEPLLASAAQQVGVDFGKFSQCMADPQTLAEVQEDAIAGGRLQIPGTPAMFLKGASGDEWLETCYGPQAVAAIVQAHKSGVKVLEPSSNMCPME